MNTLLSSIVFVIVHRNVSNTKTYFPHMYGSFFCLVDNFELSTFTSITCTRSFFIVFEAAPAVYLACTCVLIQSLDDGFEWLITKSYTDFHFSLVTYFRFRSLLLKMSLSFFKLYLL